jgi:hypothetical protein
MNPRPDSPNISELFHATVDLPPDERCQYLIEHCPDPEQRQRVERLVAADAELTRDSPLSSASAALGNQAPGPAEGSKVQPPGRDDPPPASIGRYRVVKELGGGGYGVVYLAHDDNCDRPVAIKVLHEKTIEAAGGADRCHKEAAALAKLDHPHILKVYSAETAGESCCYIVSQYIEGRTLAARLAEGKMNPTEAAKFVAVLADALQHAHEHGIIHRDVKPANILLDEKSGKPYLIDFGVVLKEGEAGPGLHFPGTPEYMSPEQASGKGGEVNGRADIFSLGVIFYEALTGRRPFIAESWKNLIYLIANVDAPSAREKDRTIPAELDRICARALARRPQDRYGSASELAEALEDWLKGREPSDPRRSAVDSVLAFWGRCRQRPLESGLWVAVVLVAIALGSLLWRHWQQGRHGVKYPPDPLEVETLYPRVTKRNGEKLFIEYAVPLVEKDDVEVTIKLNRAAFIYVVWIDSENNVIPLYPWKDRKWEERLSETKQKELKVPGDDESYPIGAQPKGIESILVFVREDMLPRDFERTLQGLPQHYPAPRIWIEKHCCMWSKGKKTESESDTLAPGQPHNPIEPIQQMQESIYEQVRTRFDDVRAVTFANRGNR